MFLIISITSFSAFLPHTQLVHQQPSHWFALCFFLFVSDFFVYMLNTNGSHRCCIRLSCSICCCYIFISWVYWPLCLCFFVCVLELPPALMNPLIFVVHDSAATLRLHIFASRDQMLSSFYLSCVVKFFIRHFHFRELSITCCRCRRKIHECVFHIVCSPVSCHRHHLFKFLLVQIFFLKVRFEIHPCAFVRQNTFPHSIFMCVFLR